MENQNPTLAQDSIASIALGFHALAPYGANGRVLPVGIKRDHWDAYINVVRLQIEQTMGLDEGDDFALACERGYWRGDKEGARRALALIERRKAAFAAEAEAKAERKAKKASETTEEEE